jgi:hypothetical protein
VLAAVIAVEGLPAEAIAAGPPAEAIVAATPEVVRGVVRPEEAHRLQAAILRQDIMVVDSSRAGARLASSHRSPSGGSDRSLLLSSRMAMKGGDLYHHRRVLIMVSVVS